MAPDLYAIVPAGGVGSRLWPLSRRDRPKFLLDLTGTGRTLLQATVDRLLPLTGPGRLVVVTGQAHAEAVRHQLPDLPAGDLLTEPSPRDSAAAIGLAAAVIHRRDPEAVVGSFAADHVIRHVDAFAAAVAEAAALARDGWLTTIGIEPTHPATGFGYIQQGDPLAVPGAPSGHWVARFVEKPDLAGATRFLDEGGHHWNAGIFVARAAVLLELLAEFVPELHRGLVELAAAWDTPQRDDAVREAWPTLTRISIDHAVAEPAAAAGRVAVVPADLGWDDIGDWASLAGLLPTESGTAVLGERSEVLMIDAGGVVVTAGGRPVTVVGIPNVVVVDTPDAVLVTTREHAQQVREAAGRAAERGWPS